MQSFGSFLSDNRSMAVLIGLIAAVVVVVLAVLIYRGLFGRRLHMAGGRSRQPRLGVVDAFDLDRQRQLVLVRRDNVEHLIMIGGPNDLVIESAFVRAQSSQGIPNGREKELPAATPLVVASLPATVAPSPPGAPPVAPAVPVGPITEPPPPPEVVPRRPEPALRGTLPPLDLTRPATPVDPAPSVDLPAADVSAPPPASETATAPAQEADPAAPAGRPVFPRPAAKPGLGTAALPPRPPLTALRPTPALGVARPPASRPTLPLQRGTSAASLRREPPPSGPGAVQPSDEPVRAAGVPRPDASLPITLDSIESLEEEMAKLLGRAADKK